MAKSYFTVPDKASGDTFTEGMWDDYIKTNINNLRVPAQVALSRSVFTSSSSSYAAVSWDTENVDTDTMWSAGDPTKCYVKTAGVYVIQALMSMNTTGVTGELGVEVNGTTLASIDEYVAGSWVSTSAVYGFSTPASDYFRILLKTPTGALSTVTGRMHGIWVGQMS